MDIYQRNNTDTKISTPQDVEMSIQDRVLIGAVATVGVLVSLALVLRFLKQPCKHRIENKEEKKEYDRFSSSYSLEDGSSDVSCKTSSSGFSDSSGASSQGTQISYCSSEFSLKSDRSTPLYQSLPDLTGKNNKSLNISSPLIFAMHSGLQEHVSTYPDLMKTDASLTAERLSQKSSNNLDSLLSNSIISLTSSWHTSDTSAKRETTVEHAYGKYLPKHYKSNLAIEEFEKPTKS